MRCGRSRGRGGGSSAPETRTPYNKRIVTLDFLGSLERSHRCGELRASDAGATVTLMGWVNGRRDHGGLIFLDLRDRTGITQVVFDQSVSAEAHGKAEAARPEYVVAITGTVRLRGAGLTNPKMATGEIEVAVHEMLLLNDAKTPPFSPADDAIANEEVRLKYRYLDLRREEMQKNFAIRSRVAMAIRNYLVEQGFLEIETPFMTRSTPEGARDYLVPSRVHPGSFYALPQSPQIFKQILMISGFDRYFQIARCFRDEDLRADRQLEFTQVDLEMSFPRQEHVFAVVEKFLSAGFAAAGITLPTPFPKMTYDEAMRNFGSDKPDLRLPGLTDVRSALTDEALATLQIDPALPVVAFRIPAVGELSRKEREDNHPMFDKNKGAKFIDDFKRLAKSFPEPAAKVRELAGAFDNDFVVIVAGDPAHHIKASDTKFEGRLSEREINVYAAAGNFRTELAKKYADRHKAFEVTERCVREADPHSGKRIDGSAAFHPMWIIDFPMFEYEVATGKWVPAHHPFTAPHEHDMANLESDPASVRANCYDLAMNGLELGSGSIRIHRKDVQQVIFKALGISDEEAHQRFGFFLDALEYGTPPHGGIALGLDRIVMLLAGASNLREVITFPKTAKAIDLMADAPTTVTEQQLRELHIRVAAKG